MGSALPSTPTYEVATPLPRTALCRQRGSEEASSEPQLPPSPGKGGEGRAGKGRRRGEKKGKAEKRGRRGVASRGRAGGKGRGPAATPLGPPPPQAQSRGAPPIAPPALQAGIPFPALLNAPPEPSRIRPARRRLRLQGLPSGPCPPCPPCSGAPPAPSRHPRPRVPARAPAPGPARACWAPPGGLGWALPLRPRPSWEAPPYAGRPRAPTVYYPMGTGMSPLGTKPLHGRLRHPPALRTRPLVPAPRPGEGAWAAAQHPEVQRARVGPGSSQPVTQPLCDQGGWPDLSEPPFPRL